MKAYYSHPIRGAKGHKATQEDMRLNNEIAIVHARHLGVLLPSIDIYCPAAHDTFPAVALRHGALTIEQVLTIDCLILQECDLVIVDCWENDMSDGMKVEIHHAELMEIPVFKYNGMDGKETQGLIKRVKSWQREKSAHAAVG